MTSYRPQVNGWVKEPSCGEKEWLCQWGPTRWVPPHSFTRARKQFHCPIPCAAYEPWTMRTYSLTYSLHGAQSFLRS